MTETWHRVILESGFANLPRVFSTEDVDELVAGLDAVMNRASATEGPIRDKAGTVYAGRNLLRLFEPAKTIWRRSPLLELLRDVLGPGHGADRRKLIGDGPTGAQLRGAGLAKAGKIGPGCVR